MGTIASQITSLTIVYSNDYSDADQRKHQSSASPVLCVEFTGEFPTQMASNAENIPIWWRHHIRHSVLIQHLNQCIVCKKLTIFCSDYWVKPTMLASLLFAKQCHKGTWFNDHKMSGGSEIGILYGLAFNSIIFDVVRTTAVRYKIRWLECCWATGNYWRRINTRNTGKFRRIWTAIVLMSPSSTGLY